RGEVGIMPAVEATHYPYVRKMACNFGWDWGPVFLTAGIWRPVALESWSRARLEQPVLLATVEGDDGVLDLAADVHYAGGAGDATDLQVRVRVGAAGAQRVTAADDGATHPGGPVATATVDGGRVTAQVRVPGVQPWWPV